jgi:hypothetical protein
MNLPDRNAPLRRPVGSGSFGTPSTGGSGLGGAGASSPAEAGW